MGFFDFIKNTVSSIGNKIGEVATSVKNYVSDKLPGVVEAGKNVVNYIANKGESAVSTVYNDTKNIISTNQQLLKEGIGGAVHVGETLINKGSETITSLGSSLSFPLVIGVAIIGGILLLNRK
ncbi:MAG: hypothetical protein QW478_01070 [Candidatus Micrarchaeaceae archaeon]